MDKKETRNIHITDEQIHLGLSPRDFSHIAECSGCAQLYADFVEKNNWISAPRNLSEAIMERSGHMDVRLGAKAGQASRQIQLFYYSLKVGAAVLGALLLLALTPYSSAFTHRSPALHLFLSNDQSWTELFRSLHEDVREPIHSDIQPIDQWR